MPKKKSISSENKIIVKGARQHNLKNVSLEIPRNKLVVFTGVSGSGKSSLVFNTIYAEGQRRYVESLSSYARQFLERMNKPDVDFIFGISPAVAIEQKTGARNPRSTVGTNTEIYDFLRLLYARIGKTYCFSCGKVVQKDTVGTVSEWLETQSEEAKFYLGFPIHSHEGRSVKEELELLKKKGFFRIFIGKELHDLNSKIPTPKTKKDIFVVIDRFKVKIGKVRETLAESIESTFKEGEGRLAIINADTNEVKSFTKFYECCGIRYEEPEPRFFSFNNPFGACPVCQGFGKTMGYEIERVVPNPNLSISDGAIVPWRTVSHSKYLRDLIKANNNRIPLTVPFKDLSAEQVNLIWDGFGSFHGLNGFFKHLEEKTYKMGIRILLSKYRGYTTCTACKGSRLRREALQVKIDDRSLYDIVSMSIERAQIFFKLIQLTEYEKTVAKRVYDEIVKRLAFLNDVGLGYLTLDRLSSTLSGGETQRINLATSLGSALMGTLYVLDEPSIGLHPRDNARLINILKSLRDLGNTVLVVEHDPEMMRESDLIFDMGPRAGVHGGEIIATGTFDQILSNENSLTGKYLSGKLSIPVPKERNFHETQSIKITGARENNLKNVSVEFPLKKLVVVTGVSGSGKSTLVHDILYGGIVKMNGGNPPKLGKYEMIEGSRYIDEIEIVDQSPIGKTPRSNPISYVKGYELIRELFANTPQARARGYKPGYFSFNVPGGRCDTCEGDGYVTIEMQFLADLYLECEDCKGTRFKKEVREVTYRGKNIVDVLNMTVDEAIEYFANNEKILKTLRVLSDVGLGYIKLGQPSTTLSGGEAQRVKLAYHLAMQKKTSHTLFIFDEPTTGLHFDDIGKLLKCFQMLIAEKNSVVIIEHNLDIIKCADWVIDLGPEAGDKGGEVVCVGTPEEIAQNERSHTGRFLKELLAT
ncbi:MAG: excinuclease ABC subunit A [Stygiobacter sp. RIFOXYC12_FULL_38_8]|nr:MAG: excinuclease ABC subunit A [Stygiobacter sp. RIFOXYA12_FULL_38_9]OGV06905.1 MAG: excinuclease ABC subunit A [Stygiobacter sp. RIFOXYB2_FULL_37_11]OGV11563.1 MAG: excinuclease ABC subunit A [Stygiobacter sp. RIFOXYA2_FULL_38_8]OGV13364.1 MAG: excinuclease ABC subunit A [Stygiobacter sp. RIFOXYC2_FULL_38_25]OGV30312.1 MAG: excinuclease ABC subunit A [Stygiobacter sp. RIFOXYC12_FULL_38_8]OGV83410.1 MAG: excinuclease ABC subunit A [Stygiobacter sp. GWF2_38_21]